MFPCLSSLLDLESWSMEMLCLLLQCSCGKLRSATAVVGFSKESVERGLFLCSTCTRHAAVLAGGSSVFHYRWLTDIFRSSQDIQRNRLCRIPNSSQKLDESTKTKESNVGLCIYRLVKVCQTVKECVFILAKDRIEHTCQNSRHHMLGPVTYVCRFFIGAATLWHVNMSFSHFSTCRVEVGGDREDPSFSAF